MLIIMQIRETYKAKVIRLLIYQTGKVKSERLVQVDETNIDISRGEGWLEGLNLSLASSSVEQSSSLNLMCLCT